MKYSKQEYEEELVHYCANCLSLAIRKVDGIDVDICMDCGNSKFEETDCESWNKLFVEFYGSSFLELEE